MQARFTNYSLLHLVVCSTLGLLYDGDLGTRSGFGGSGTPQVRRRVVGSFLVERRLKDKVTVGLAVGLILFGLGQF